MRAAGLVLALTLLVAASPARAATAEACAREAVTVLAKEGAQRFAVELAITPEEQARGLMFRESLASDRGMLFLYEPPRPARFWMKNTLIPLDIIFIDDTGEVLNIARMAEPLSLEPRPSKGSVRAVLEIAGGLSARLGIGPGTRVIHPAFRAAPAPHLCPAE